MPAHVILYGTEFCHLCEEAERLLRPVCQRLGIAVHELDIAGDDHLEALYATRVPVLYRPDTGAELGWPFDSEALYRFLF